MRNKIFSISILILLIGVSFVVPQVNTPIEATEEQLGSEFDKPSKAYTPQEALPTIKQSPIDYNTWYEGETVKNTIAFSNVNYQLDAVTISVGSETGEDTYRGFQSYTTYTTYKVTNSDSDDTTYVIGFFTLDVARVGTTYYKLQCTARKATGWLSGDIHESSFSLNSNYIQSDGKAHFQIYSQQYYDSGNQWAYFMMTIFALNVDGTWGVLASGLTSNTISGTFTSAHLDGGLKIFYFYHQANDIIEQSRMHIKYNSPTIKIGKIDFYNPVFETTVTLNLSKIWDYSSITPLASTSFIDNDLTITNTIPTTYSVLFNSNCTNYLVIEDASHQYLTDVGFETGEYSGDLAQQSGYEWDSISISTEQSFEGTYSVELENTVATRSILHYNAFVGRVRNFYLQMSVYFESVVAGTLYINYYSGSSWTSLPFDNTIIGRWQTMKIFVPDAGYSGTIGNFKFDTLSVTDFEGKLFIDNIKILETSTTIETFGYSESSISSTLISWDGYKNPVMPNADLELELWDRTAQTLEESYSIITNEYGVASWTLEKGLELKEYELRAYSLDSYFGSAQTQTDVTNSVTYWTLGNEDVGTETISCVDSSIVFEFRESGSVNWEIQYNPSGTFDISSSDILYYTYRSNVTTKFSYKWIRTDTSNQIINQTDQDFSANTIYHMLEYFRHEDYVETGTFDDTTIDMIYHRASLPLGWVKVEIFDFRFINTQKLYFTPSLPTETDYAEIELSDSWDFTEGDTEDWENSYASVNWACENGYLHFETTAGYGYTIIRTGFLVDFDLNYDYIIIRAKINDTTDTPILKPYQSGGSNNADFKYITTTDYATYVWDIGSLDWSGDYQIRILFDQIGVWTVNMGFEIDFISLAHKDSWLEETNDYATDVLHDTWDFEEEDTEEWTRSGNVGWTGTIANGYYNIDITDSVSQYCKVLLDTTYSIDTDYYTHLVIKIQSFELFDLRFYAGDSYVGGQLDVYPSDFTTYVFDLSLDADWTGTITANTYFRLDHDSGVFDGDEWYKIDYVYLIHQETMPYETIQNSVLIESETNDYQYNLWLDYNYIGTFSDLSIIPLIQTAGNHSLSVHPFKTDGPYSTQQIFSYYYEVEADTFSVFVNSFYLSDLYVNTYVTSNFDGNYYVYQDNVPDGSGVLTAIGTTISSVRELTEGSTIDYAIKFTYGAEIIWFNTTYSNPSTEFYITDYRVQINDTHINIIWDTSRNAIDSLTAIEDEVTKVTDDPASPTNWVKSTIAGTHYVTLIFEATDYNDILYSFTYTVAAIEEFQVNVLNVIPSDDFLNIYCTSNYDYTYDVYTNSTPSGSGNGLSVGTFIIIPKTKIAGLYNLTVAFVNGSETVLFMTWYSNLIPPPNPFNTLYRDQSEGYFNITLVTNLAFYWIDIYHDNVLIVDDSTASFYSIEKALKVGWHNIYFQLYLQCLYG